MTDLTPEATLAIQKETRKTVTGIAAIFGIANIAVVLIAVWSFWTYAQSQIDGISKNVKNDVLNELTTKTEDIRQAVNSANKLIGKLEERNSSLDKLDTEIASLDSRVELLTQDELLSGASDFLKSWDGSVDADALVKAVDVKVDMQASLNCDSPRIFSGSQPQGNTAWTQYKTNAAQGFTKIDTSEANFVSTPQYFVSFSGSGSWSAQGVNAIYAPTPTGFTTYIQWNDPSSKTNMVNYATKHWNIHWMAIGC